MPQPQHTTFNRRFVTGRNYGVDIEDQKINIAVAQQGQQPEEATFITWRILDGGFKLPS